MNIPTKELPAIYLAYAGANMIVNDSRLHPNNRIKPVCGAIGDIIIYSHTGGYGIVGDCQLLLTPLPLISDEDAIEVAKMIQEKTNVDWVGAGKDSIIAFLNTAFFGFESYFEDEDSRDEDSRALLSGCIIHIIDFLRSPIHKGKLKPVYNIGYGKYSAQDLIEAHVVKNDEIQNK